MSMSVFVRMSIFILLLLRLSIDSFLTKKNTVKMVLKFSLLPTGSRLKMVLKYLSKACPDCAAITEPTLACYYCADKVSLIGPLLQTRLWNG